MPPTSSGSDTTSIPMLGASIARSADRIAGGRAQAARTRAIAAIGRLMKKIQFQPKRSVTIPPSTGPIASESIEMPM